MTYGRRAGLALVLTAGITLSVAAGGCGPTVPARSADPSFPFPTEGRPERIAIDHNTLEAEHIGRTADGRQFFLTTPFDVDGRSFVALYRFDQAGQFVEAEIDPFSEDLYQRRLDNLGKATFDRIVVEPFEVERFGLTFGLVVSEPTTNGEIWWVTAEPGDYMAFSPPWDLGIYDT